MQQAAIGGWTVSVQELPLCQMMRHLLSQGSLYWGHIVPGPENH